MPYEVQCGECHKQILIEDLGVEVACPYCQTTLILDEEDIVSRDDVVSSGDSHVVTSEDEADFGFDYSEGGSSSILANGESNDSQVNGSGVSSAILDEEPPSGGESKATEEDVPDFNFLTSADEQETREDIPNFGSTKETGHTGQESETPKAEPTTSDEEEVPDFSFVDPSAEEAGDPSESDSVPNFNFVDRPDDGPAETPAIQIDTESPTPATARKAEATASQAKRESTQQKSNQVQEAVPVASSTYARRNQGLPPRVVHFLISYSILITIAFLYLLMNYYTAKPHQLESLPDIAPPDEGEIRLIRENAVLAPGHTLQIGETQRFGNIELTPKAVKRGSLYFDHFQDDRLGGNLPPTRPVLKLVLEIKNVSDDQMFPPLDLRMMSIREYDSDLDIITAHNWVCRKENLGKRTGRILMYDHPATSAYDIRGLKTRPLKPGETMTTFLPTQEEDLGTLEGDLVWRFQIRKGFHPHSLNGVTTLVEVEFSSDDITRDKT